MNQYAAEHTQAVAGGVPILALDMYEHAYHMDFGANAKAYAETFLRNVDWKSVEGAYEDAIKVSPPRALVQEEFKDIPGVGVEEVKAMLDAGRRSSSSTPARAPRSRAPRKSSRAPRGAIRRAAGLDRGALEGEARGRLLRLRLPRRLPHRRGAPATPASTPST
jgi:hypothetical protein